jgi:hypothetical protein
LPRSGGDFFSIFDLPLHRLSNILRFRKRLNRNDSACVYYGVGRKENYAQSSSVSFVPAFNHRLRRYSVSTINARPIAGDGHAYHQQRAAGRAGFAEF